MKPSVGIYTPLGRDGYELCQPSAQSDFETVNILVNGMPRHPNWKPISMRLIHEDEGKNLIPSDSPWLGAHALIFRQKAIERLGATLQQYGELLPLQCPDEELVVYNPTRLVDGLDEEQSSILRFSSGKIMLIKQYAFRESVIKELDVFKIPNLRVSPTFVSHRFVEQWKSSGLVGLDFKQVWAPPN